MRDLPLELDIIELELDSNVNWNSLDFKLMQLKELGLEEIITEWLWDIKTNTFLLADNL